MKTRSAIASALASVLAAQAAQPIQLHPDNPHYFLWRTRPTVLITAGEHYAIYVNGGTQAELVLELPAGHYKAEWLNTKTAAVEKVEKFDHAGNTRTLVSPAYLEDIALRVNRTE